MTAHRDPILPDRAMTMGLMMAIPGPAATLGPAAIPDRVVILAPALPVLAAIPAQAEALARAAVVPVRVAPAVAVVMIELMASAPGWTLGQ